MKKIVKFFTVFAIFLFIFTACSNKGNSGKQEISDDDSENQVSDGDKISDDYPIEPDGTEKFVTISSSDYSEDDCPETDPVYDGSVLLKNDIPDVIRETVEGDVYKINGNTLWISHSYKGLVTVDISDPKDLKFMDSINLEGYVREIYFHGERAYILVSNASGTADDENRIKYYGRKYSKLVAINTEDPKNLSIISEFEIDGYASNSQQIGDIIYIVATDEAYSWIECDGTRGSRHDQSTIVSVNVKDPLNIKLADKVSAEGSADFVYFSEKHIYTAESKTDAWGDPIGESRISIFDISDPEGKIVKKSTFQPEGFIKGQGRMQEIDNCFYVLSGNVLESFDVSDPENVTKLNRLYLSSVRDVKINGYIMYVVGSYYSEGMRHDTLETVALTPEYLVSIDKQDLFGEISDFEFIATKMLTVEMENEDYRSKLVLYDIEKPERPKEISGVLFKKNTSVYNFRIFDESGLIICPVIEHSADGSLNKIYIIDFDAGKELKLRGFITMDEDDFARFGTVAKNHVYAVADYKMVSVDVTDRDNPKILSEQKIADRIPGITKCGDKLCGINNRKLSVYDGATNSVVWRSKKWESSESANLLENGKNFYIYDKHQTFCGYGDDFYADYPIYVKIIKNGENNSFEETETIRIYENIGYYAAAAVSENNIMAFRSSKGITYSENGRDRHKVKSELHFLDMNDPAEKITASKIDFDYLKLFIENRIFVSGDTFWTSGCIKNTSVEEENEYFCYAVPFTVDKPAKPKAGKRINIPGELMGISKDGQYLYTKTPALKSEKECEDLGNCKIKIETSDFYILKLNNKKNSADVVRKETLENWSLINYNSDKYPKQYYVSNDIFVKDDKVFFVSESYYLNMECVSESNIVYEIKIVSATDGKEIFSGSFEQVSFFNDVQDGGMLLSTNKEWVYVTADGKTKKVELSKDLGTSGQYSPNSAQLIGDKVYVGTLWGGIYSFDVK